MREALSEPAGSGTDFNWGVSKDDHGGVVALGWTIARGEATGVDIECLMEEAIRVASATSVVRSWKEAAARHSRLTQDLHAAVKMLRLLPYLPKMCSVCRRVDL